MTESSRGGEMGAELSVNKDDFRLETLEDEIRVDGLFRDILKHFYVQLLEDGLTPERATLLANSADYYVRDFVVDSRRRNLFEEKPGIVRQFAGNWYIVNTVEPDIPQLSGHLDGIRAFYRFLRSRDLVSAEFLRQIENECADTDFYAGRISSFWDITGDGYAAWEQECTLKGHRP